MDGSPSPRSALTPVAARRRTNLSAVLLDGNPAIAADSPALRTVDATWTYAELADAVGAAAGWLAARGARRGDVVLLALADAPRWIALFLGAARVGAVCALAGHALGAGPLRSLARGLAPALVVHDGPRLHSRAPQVGAADLDAVLGEAGRDPGPLPVAG